MLNQETAAAIVSAHNAAADFAAASLEIGKPFLGAWGVAKALGYPKNSLEFEVATSAAYSVFRQARIICNDNGEITELEIR